MEKLGADFSTTSSGGLVSRGPPLGLPVLAHPIRNDSIKQVNTLFQTPETMFITAKIERFRFGSNK